MGAIFRSVYTHIGVVHESTGKFPFAAGERHWPLWGEMIRDQVPFRECTYDSCDRIITEKEYQAEDRAETAVSPPVVP